MSGRYQPNPYPHQNAVRAKSLSAYLKMTCSQFNAMGLTADSANW
jgi:hypothetical protein